MIAVHGEIKLKILVGVLPVLENILITAQCSIFLSCSEMLDMVSLDGVLNIN